MAVNIEKPWQIKGIIRLNNIHFKHNQSKTNWNQGQVTIEVTTHSVKAHGSIFLNGEPLRIIADKSTKEPLKIDIKGHAILLNINAQIEVFVSPNIQLIKTKNNWLISGTTNIEHGVIKSRKIPGTTSLPDNTIIIGQARNTNMITYLTKFVHGSVAIKTNQDLIVEDLFGFQGDLEGQLVLTFIPNKEPTATGHCQLNNAHYIQQPNIHVIQSKVTFNNSKLNNPMIDFRLTRNISEIIFDLKNPTHILQGKKVGLIISGTALWPNYDLYADDSTLTKIQIITALLSGTPNGFSPDQDILYAFSLLHTSPTKIGKPLLSPLTQIKNELGLDQLYLSTPLESEDLLHNNLSDTNLTMSKSFHKNLMATYRINLSDDDFLLALNYLVNDQFHIQLYSTRTTEDILSINSKGINIIYIKTIE